MSEAMSKSVLKRHAAIQRERERRTATMSETDEMLLKGFEHWATNEEAQLTKRVTPKGVLKLVSLARESLQLRAQLTEVTQERDEAKGEGLRLFQEAMEHGRQTEAALAPLRAVVEDLRSWLFEQFDVFKSRDSITARAIAASFKDVIVKLDALSALPADPSAPTLR